MKISPVAVGLVLVGFAGGLWAQTSGSVHYPSGLDYDVKFLTQAGTVDFCVHEVTVNNGATTGIDRNSDGNITQADALACTKALVADNTTANSIIVTIDPRLASNVLIAGRSYSSGEAGSAGPSEFSNWHILAATIGKPTLLD